MPRHTPRMKSLVWTALAGAGMLILPGIVASHAVAAHASSNPDPDNEGMDVPGRRQIDAERVSKRHDKPVDPPVFDSRVDEIIYRLVHANANRDHVMVVAHRGSWWKDGKIVLAENSMSAIDRAVDIGAEMVELDVQKTSDGVYVILHDTTLDRTTTCTGPVADQTLAEVRNCNLVVEGTGEEIAEVVPTLEEAYEAIRGRILMNVDIKLGVEELVGVMEIARDMGVDHQVVIKNRTGTPEQVEAAQATLDAIDFPVLFMPLIDDRDVTDFGPIKTTYKQFAPEAIEVLNRWVPGTRITQDGGINFSKWARRLAYRYDTHLWINTLFQGSNARISGGRGDPIAVPAGLTQEGWGFWVDVGATIFQSDEPEALIEYLESRGARRPYRAE
ncbi:MAG: glycerophosphodiester phosphodiesterase family protein [Myxococcales bacterium FL481]|nr:MAG: glycerophosphodiester phosphodiesterase family protein [Myxococcales bacterium FL481]